MDMADIAPGGRLRFGLNYQNFLLVSKDGRATPPPRTQLSTRSVPGCSSAVLECTGTARCLPQRVLHRDRASLLALVMAADHDGLRHFHADNGGTALLWE